MSRTAQGGDLIKESCNSTMPRIAVTVDMIATCTDIKPLEVLVFLRDVHSRVYFEQMKGAARVCESDETESRPLDRKPSVPLKTLLQRVIFPAAAMKTRSPRCGPTRAARPR